MVSPGQSLRVNVLASHFNLSNLWMPDDAYARNSGESLSKLTKLALYSS
ncbi:MAG: hypothetical protein RL242_3378, partial [Pseudomonadota bacterium]